MKRIITYSKSILNLNPELAKQWHPIKNDDLLPSEVTPGSNKKVWWKCEKAHEWKAIINNRNAGRDCPCCSGRTACSDNNLAALNPDLAKQWHPIKNDDLLPSGVTPGSNKKAWWICHKGHEWPAKIADRNKGSDCPYCAGKIFCIDNSLSVINPELAKQWHPMKNDNLLPSGVTKGSQKQAWWICHKGHEWKAVIGSRNAGRGCPYCSGLKVCSDNNLAVLNPGLAKQWHPIKNGDLKSSDVTPGSRKKVWWFCPKGHVYNAEIYDRNDGDNCPYCSGHRVCSDNNLAALDPDLAKQWHPTKNGTDHPSHFTIGSQKKAWWRCSKNHEWISSINNRSKGKGCPKCRLQCSRLEICLYSELKLIFGNVLLGEKINNLEIDIYIKQLNIGIEVDGYYWHKKKYEWDGYKNTTLLKEGIKIIRIREYPLKKIEINDIIHHQNDPHIVILKKLLALINGFNLMDLSNYIDNYRVNNKLLNKRLYKKILQYLPGPLPGNSLLDINTELVKQWHPIKNKDLKPSNLSPGSNEKIWWQCHKGHEWKAVISSRSKGSGCPYCSGLKACSDNNLAVLNPDLAKQWHPIKNSNLLSSEVSTGSNKKVWWQCHKGHEWKAVISSRSRGSGCPYCSGLKVCSDNNLAVLNPDLAKQWHPIKNGDLKSSDVTPGSNKKVWWLCPKGHLYDAKIIKRKYGHNCPYCSGRRVCNDSNLAVVNTAVAKQWHPIKNGDLKPSDVKPGSGKKVWWLCPKGHAWSQSIISRTTIKNNECPVCNSVLFKYPELAKQWHPSKNGILKPSDVRYDSGKKIWWLCLNRHEWRSTISSRNKGNGCKECFPS